MTNSHKYTPVEINGGYTTSDENYDKKRRKTARKKYRTNVRSNLSKIQNDPQDLFEFTPPKRPEKLVASCMHCADHAKYYRKNLEHECYKSALKDDVEKRQNEVQKYEKTLKPKVFQEYRKVWCK
jgi:hypothetical protein